AFDIPVEEASGADFAETLAAATRAIDAARGDVRPHALVSHAVRLGPHSKGDDTRPPEALRAAWAHDPLATLRQTPGGAAGAIARTVAALTQGALAAVEAAP